MNTVRFILLVLLIGITRCHSPLSEVEAWKQRAERVTIVRDDFGVPHIYGKSDADAVFGLLYAQCEDDFKRIERNYLWAIGRLAEVEGEDALYSDLRANLFMTQEEAIALYETSPDWLKDLCQAFADGVNYYLYTHPDVKPALLTRFEPWMPLYFTEGSIGGDIESISTADIKAFYEQQPVASSRVHHQLPEPQGSNGFALSGKLTQSGKAMLLINPHTSFYFRGEVHVVSEEGLKAYGAVTWGQFFVYQGFNEHNGWMHTSSYTDVMDEFLETIEVRDGKRMYRYGEEWRPVEEKTVTLSYKKGDSTLQKKFPIYRTHHGPVTHQIDGRWVSTAMMWKPVEALTQSYKRTKTTTMDEFLEVMRLRTNSSNNTVYADAAGNIAFFQGNFIPRRDVRFNFDQPVDGSDPATDWQGLHTIEEAIRVVNPGNGWIQNCNSTPFTSALNFSPRKEDYPYYMATEPENFRGVHAVKVLTGIQDVTIDQLITTAYDPYLPAFERLIPGLVAAWDQQGKQYSHLKPAIEVLRGWDYRVSLESKAMTLAHFYATVYMQKGARQEGQSPMDRMIAYGTTSPLGERLAMLDEVVNKLNSDFGQWDVAWGEVNRFQRLDGAIVQHYNDSLPSIPVGMASGNWGALASFGVRGNTNTKRIYGSYGNSFVAVVEFGDRVKAKSLLAGGQSGDPASPHFYDQAQRYADVQFKDVAYYRDDVEKRAVKTYHPGEPD
jgi:acyl-homoserine-lactone acylase